MKIFWTTFRKNFWQFYRGITAFAVGFAMIGNYLWHYSEPSYRNMGNPELYGAFCMFGVGVFVIALRYRTIRDAERAVTRGK